MLLLLTIEKENQGVFFETELSKPLRINTVLLSLAILNTSQLQTDILLCNVILVPQHYLVPWSSENHGDNRF